MKKRGLAFLLALTVALQPAVSVCAQTVSDNGLTDKTTDAVGGVTDEEAAEVGPESEEAKQEVRESLLALRSEFPIIGLIAKEGVLPIGTQAELTDVEFDGTSAILIVQAFVNGVSGEYRIGVDEFITSDEGYRQWKEKELVKVTGIFMETEGTTATYIRTNFPAEYQSALIALQSAHPTWNFVPYHTGLDWNAALAAECQGARSLVHYTAQSSYKSSAYDSKWYYATAEGVSYYLNPLNYLNEERIFAMEQLSFRENMQNKQGVVAVVSGTWMNNRTLEDGSGGYYKDVIYEIGQATGVSPYHLAARIVQEQGVSGASPMISGTYGGYEGYYNYFNIKASGAGNAVYATGLAYARSAGWNTRYASILGGARFLGQNYISRGQDTLYLQKYDVESSDGSLYSHQYMQNISAPYTEAVSVRKAYSNAGALEASFVFRVPVFGDGPAGTGVTTTMNDEEIEAFVKRLYKLVLNREADADGLKDWSNRLKNGYYAADLIYGFFQSEEMTNRRLSDEAYLKVAYQAILDRNADAGGLSYWKGELSGGCTRLYVLKGFVASAEFANLCEEYGILVGSMDQYLSNMDKNGGQTKLCVRLYQNILGRAPDTDGLNYWTGNLQNGLSGCRLLEGFFNSQEFANMALTDEEYVEILYTTILGRKSDAAGKADWLGRLGKGSTRKDVLAGFAYSPEFSNMCSDAGINVGKLGE